MSGKLLKAVRFDRSDLSVFPRAAEPGEWVIPGAFLFADADPGELTGKLGQAFANGFLGLSSFGWSTLAAVAEIAPATRAELLRAFAARLQAEFGAPDLAAAEAAANSELNFAESLCEHPVNTLLAVSRAFEGDGIRERFRIVEPPREAPHARIWTIEMDQA